MNWMSSMMSLGAWDICLFASLIIAALFLLVQLSFLILKQYRLPAGVAFVGMIALGALLWYWIEFRFEHISQWDTYFVCVITALLLLLATYWLSYTIKALNLHFYVVLVIATALCSIAWFLPAYYTAAPKDAEPLAWIEAALTSVQRTIRLFAADDNFDEVMGILEKAKDGHSVFSFAWMDVVYPLLGRALVLLAPILTFTFILSFFKNMIATLRCCVSAAKEMHVFSELNEKTLALAKSIVNNRKRRVLIVYADIVDKNEEAHMDLVDGAKAIGAVLIRRDMATIKFLTYRRKRPLNFYLISEDESEKIRHAESIIRNYKQHANAKLYLYSDCAECKNFLKSYDKETSDFRLRVIRINDIRALIYHHLNENGMELFFNACDVAEAADGPNAAAEREVSAVVVGLGQYGMEMTKALLWYCQLPGYRVKITAFDEQEQARSKFMAACPEIVPEQGKNSCEDMRYYLNIQKASVGTQEFLDKLVEVKDATYIFVCLGTDAQNLEAAMEIRARLAKEHRFPQIDTVVYNSTLKERLSRSWGDKHHIGMIGDLNDFYSEKTVINSALIAHGLRIHKRWDSGPNAENNFYMDDYNYCASLSSALHRELRARILEAERDGSRAAEKRARKRSKNDASKQAEALKAKREKWAKAFPFYYSDTGLIPGIKAETMHDVFKCVNEPSSLGQMSLEMNALNQCLADEFQSEFEEKHLSDYQKWLDQKGETVAATLKNKYPVYLARAYYISLGTRDQKRLLGALLQYARKNKVSIPRVKVNRERKYLDRYDHCMECVVSAGKQEKAIELIQAKLIKMLPSLAVSLKPLDDIQEYFDRARCVAYIEHVRWNAYMRTEGFSKEKKNTDYRLHHDLIPVEELSFQESIKDI